MYCWCGRLVAAHHARVRLSIFKNNEKIQKIAVCVRCICVTFLYVAYYISPDMCCLVAAHAMRR